jgi:hypothetical protein
MNRHILYGLILSTCCLAAGRDALWGQAEPDARPLDFTYIPGPGVELSPESLAEPPLAEQPLSDADKASRPSCLDGVVYDDHRFENAFLSISICVGCPPDFPGTRHSYVMLFEPPRHPAKLEKVCIAWGKGIPNGASSVNFDIRVWRADGPNGQPGTLLATIPGFSATRLSYYRFPTAGKLYSYDVSSANVIVDGPVYIGPVYYPAQDYVEILFDGSRKTKKRPTFHGVEDEPPSEAPPDSPYFTYRAFGIRAKFGRP